MPAAPRALFEMPMIAVGPTGKVSALLEAPPIVTEMGWSPAPALLQSKLIWYEPGATRPEKLTPVMHFSAATVTMGSVVVLTAPKKDPVGTTGSVGPNPPAVSISVSPGNMGLASVTG